MMNGMKRRDGVWQMRLKRKVRNIASIISPNIDRIPKSKLDIEKGTEQGINGSSTRGAARDSQFLSSQTNSSKRFSSIPSNANSEGSIVPVPAINNWHLPSHITPWPIQDLMRMPVICSGRVVRVVVRMRVRRSIVGM